MRASSEGLGKIQNALTTVTDENGQKYAKAKESHAIAAARLYWFNQAPEIKNKEWTDKTKLPFEIIQEKLVNQNFLSKNPCTNEETISLSGLKKKICEEDLAVPSIYGKTWQDFHNGREINDNAFKAYCGILGLNWQDIAELDEPLSAQLERCLGELNHYEQVTWVNYLAQKSGNILGFMTRLESDNDPRFIWLLRCLIKPQNEEREVKKVLVNLSVYGGLEELLCFLSGKLGITASGRTLPAKTKDFAKKLCRDISKEGYHLLFIFQNLDQTDQGFLDSIKQQFWMNLIQVSQETQLNKKIMMCWLDTQENPNLSWRRNYTFLTRQETMNHWEPSMLIELTLTNQFDCEALKQWIRCHQVGNILGQIDYNLIYDQTAVEQTAISLIEASNQGQPDLLLQTIYERCNLRWEDHQHRWQKL